MGDIMETKKSIWEYVIGLISISTPIISGAGFIVKLINKTDISWFDIFLIVVILLQFCVIAYVILYRKFSYKAYNYPVCRKDYNYIVEEKEINYIINKEGKLEYSSVFTIESNDCHLESVFGRFIWTGTSKTSIPACSGDEIKEIVKWERLGIWNHYRIMFHNCVKKGEIVKYKCKWPVIDQPESSSPFVSSDTVVPTKKLIFNLDLGKNYCKAVLHIEEYNSIAEDFPFSHKTVNLDDEGKAQVVFKPSRGRNYRLRWTWNNSGETSTSYVKTRA